MDVTGWGSRLFGAAKWGGNFCYIYIYIFFFDLEVNFMNDLVFIVSFIETIPSSLEVFQFQSGN